MTDKIIYFADPMCSWCYGFAPEITRVANHFSGDYAFELVMGGLRPGGTETMSDLKSMLSHHWKDVEKRSGQPFSYDILQQSDFVYDTEPPCRAVVTVRHLRPEAEFSFFKSIQETFYRKNQNTNHAATYEQLAVAYDLEPGTFLEHFESEIMKERTRSDFSRTHQFGIQGFPAVVVESNESYYLLTRGYAEADHMIDALESLAEKK